jgi:hypothetical protein
VHILDDQQGALRYVQTAYMPTHPYILVNRYVIGGGGVASQPVNKGPCITEQCNPPVTAHLRFFGSPFRPAWLTGPRGQDSGRLSMGQWCTASNRDSGQLQPTVCL